MFVSKYLDDYLIGDSYNQTSDYEKKEKERKFYLSDSGKCKRVRYLKRHGIKSTFEKHVHWILQIGNLYHDWAYKALESSGVLLSAEEIVENDHFKGRYDGIVKSPSNTKHLVDFKSAGSYKINKAVKREDDEDYLNQLLSYLIFLKDEGRDDIESAIVCYLNKEPGNKCPYTFLDREYHLTNWRESKLREDMEELVSYWENQEIPPCSCPAWMKPYNAYLPFCQAEDMDSIHKVVELQKSGKQVYTTKDKVFYREDDEGPIEDGNEIVLEVK